MIELLRCRQCKELVYSDDTITHGCALGFDLVADDLEQSEYEEFLEDIHNDESFFNMEPFFC